MPKHHSLFLTQFSKKLTEALEEQRDGLWSDINTPIIEDIPKLSDKLVTFLYRLSADERDGATSIYLLSGAAGYSFTEQSVN
ncbi:TPA: hypothetical protein SJ233_003072 [Legionella pneumophila]|jgi:hypothetical protein|nr:hypothetical protein [Legionella pneumophila]